MTSMHDREIGEDYEHGEQDEEVMLDPDEAAEEVPEDEDAPMDSDAEEEEGGEIQLQNDSFAHFDQHKDSIFAIAQHPTLPQIIATGGGDDVGYVFDLSQAPASSSSQERKSIRAAVKLDGHSDSVNAITFTLPSGDFLLTAGLDGQLRSYHRNTTTTATASPLYSFVASSQEVEEINFLAACPHPQQPNVVALGASDGSVWVYRMADANAAQALEIVQAYYMHTASCTAGCWTPDGKLLATVSEDGSMYVWDVFGEAAAAGISPQAGSQSLLGLTTLDERFKVEDGLYSIAISPGGTLAAVGGAGGNIRVVGLPRLSAAAAAASKSHAAAGAGAGAAAKPGGGRAAAVKGATGAADATAAGLGQTGQILASLQTQTDSIETLAFAPPPVTLLAAGSVDGSIAVFDAGRAFAVRRVIRDAHDGEAVIKCEFVPSSPLQRGGTGGGSGDNSHLAWLLTSAGNDGVLRRWDLRGGGGGSGAQSSSSSSSNQGRMGEWKGHRGGGEGGGILGFVQSPDGGQTVVTAGDDGVALAFKVATS